MVNVLLRSRTKVILAVVRFECGWLGKFKPLLLPVRIMKHKLTYLQICVIFILLETKGISLERMDRLFGEVDAVSAGEEQTSAEKIEAITYSGHEMDDKVMDLSTNHVESTSGAKEKGF